MLLMKQKREGGGGGGLQVGLHASYKLVREIKEASGLGPYLKCSSLPQYSWLVFAWFKSKTSMTSGFILEADNLALPCQKPPIPIQNP